MLGKSRSDGRELAQQERCRWLHRCLQWALYPPTYWLCCMGWSHLWGGAQQHICGPSGCCGL